VEPCDGCESAGPCRKKGNRVLCDDCLRAENTGRCAYCGNTTSKEEFGGSIHRDGFLIGPQVPLCCLCAAEDGPTCEDIWAKISRTPAVSP
jgi:hypothetical protein